MAGLVWALDEYHIRGQDVTWLAWGLTVFAGLTMVSNFKFYSGKDVNLRKAVPFWVVVMIAFSVVAIVQIADNLPEVLFSIFLVYAASGYVMWAVQFSARRKARQEPPPPRQEPGAGI